MPMTGSAARDIGINEPFKTFNESLAVSQPIQSCVSCIVTPTAYAVRELVTVRGRLSRSA